MKTDTAKLVLKIGQATKLTRGKGQTHLEGGRKAFFVSGA